MPKCPKMQATVSLILSGFMLLKLRWDSALPREGNGVEILRVLQASVDLRVEFSDNVFFARNFADGGGSKNGGEAPRDQRLRWP
jgi:hypothetical protein